MAGKKNRYIATLLGLMMMITGCSNQSTDEENPNVTVATTESSSEEVSMQSANKLNTDIIGGECNNSASYNVTNGLNSETSSISNQLNKEMEEEREYVPDSDSGDTGYNPKHYDLDLNETFRNNMLGKSIDLFKYGYSMDSNVVMSPYSVINQFGIVLLGISDTGTYEGKTAMSNWFGEGGDNSPNYVLSEIKGLNVKFLSQYEFLYNGVFVTGCTIKNVSGFSKYNTDYVSYNNGENPCDEVNRIIQNDTGHIAFNENLAIENTTLLSIGYFEDSWIDEADWYITDHEFVNQDGSSALPNMALFNENLDYIETDSAYGIIKPFKHEDDYSMIFILPKEEDLDSYIDSLDKEEFDSLMESRGKMDVSLMVPSFVANSEMKLNGYMEKEDLGGVLSKEASYYTFTSEDMEIGQILHKTYFSLNGRGARSYDDITETYFEKDVQINERSVLCDKPFIYIIIDNDTNIPVIMGTVSNM